jgi:GAF domain-containing protein
MPGDGRPRLVDGRQVLLAVGEVRGLARLRDAGDGLRHPRLVAEPAGGARFTQAELEAHPQWKHFGTEAAAHPPMRGWRAVPIVDRAGTVWGLLQLSDRCDGEFTEEDERHFVAFAALVSEALEALWDVRNLRRAAAR